VSRIVSLSSYGLDNWTCHQVVNAFTPCDLAEQEKQFDTKMQPLTLKLYDGDPVVRRRELEGTRIRVRQIRADLHVSTSVCGQVGPSAHLVVHGGQTRRMLDMLVPRQPSDCRVAAGGGVLHCVAIKVRESRLYTAVVGPAWCHKGGRAVMTIGCSVCSTGQFSSRREIQH